MVPGELFPIIQTKHRREPKYKKIKEKVFEEAKASYIAEAKEKRSLAGAAEVDDMEYDEDALLNKQL